MNLETVVEHVLKAFDGCFREAAANSRKFSEAVVFLTAQILSRAQARPTVPFSAVQPSFLRAIPKTSSFLPSFVKDSTSIQLLITLPLRLAQVLENKRIQTNRGIL